MSATRVAVPTGVTPEVRGVRDEVPDDVLRARAYLSRVAEPGSVALWDSVRLHGPVEVARSIRLGTAGQSVLALCEARRERVDPDADLEAAARCGARLVTPESADWPHFGLAALEATGIRRAAAFHAGAAQRDEAGEPVPPLALWVAGPGDLAGLAVRSVALVGSRAATAYGEHVTADLAYRLAREGLTVVSGGAYGIDATAHRAALAADGATVIVSAGGPDRAYPSGNARLFEQAADSGLVISECPPGAHPQRQRFLSRNRLIAAFGTGTVVVEAGARSGARNTATHCERQGRPLMAVPGPVTSPMSAGCHALLARDLEPAILVTGAADVLRVIGPIGVDESGGPGPAGPSGPTGSSGDLSAQPGLRERLDRVDGEARRVFDGLPARGTVDADRIAVRCGVRITDVLRALPMLELAGLVERDEGGFRVARRQAAT